MSREDRRASGRSPGVPVIRRASGAGTLPVPASCDSISRRSRRTRIRADCARAHAPDSYSATCGASRGSTSRTTDGGSATNEACGRRVDRRRGRRRTSACRAEGDPAVGPDSRLPPLLSAERRRDGKAAHERTDDRRDHIDRSNVAERRSDPRRGARRDPLRVVGREVPRRSDRNPCASAKSLLCDVRKTRVVVEQRGAGSRGGFRRGRALARDRENRSGAVLGGGRSGRAALADALDDRGEKHPRAAAAGGGRGHEHPRCHHWKRSPAKTDSLVALDRSADAAMTLRNTFLILLAIAVLVMFASVARRLSLVSYGLAANRESQEVLRRSLEDQKALARADPAHRDVYRRRFEDTRRLLTRIEIMALTRRQVMRQFELVLVGLVTVIVAAAVAAYFLEQRSRTRRLARIGDALQSLSMGDAEIAVDDRGRDVIGRIARMIEETSGVIGRERRRTRALEHLSAWQEAARRHAHEMRTPLTAAHLEIRQLVQEAQRRLPSDASTWSRAEASILEELEHLRRFTNEFVALANVGAPKLEVRDVRQLLEEFCMTFASNWPHLTLHCAGAPSRRCAALDREMLRRVLVNLCNNSALAAGERSGNVTFTIGGGPEAVTVDVVDDGPGVAPEVRRRIFEPYTTTRKTGEGMGLGLAISKKILLDHHGDLELSSSTHGAAFRITLPAAACPE
ncbi:MAG: hypothetical protein DMF56_20105 [Acidobacteria bacterium]|nr:MAG: hypothetical protein DMF56_20105 [Acidobacteriota bacterium]